ncbi:MAG: type II secretion system protein [Planctomycetes bacterium]|nr:type II secretion system protein [Planctomycetota bacterium]
MARRSRSAYTLLEILVVVGVFTVLGSILVSLLYGGLRTWRRGEVGRQAFEKGQIALDQIREDLLAVFTTESPDTFCPARPVEIRFSCRYVEDPENPGIYKQELAFVRTAPQQVKNLLGSRPGNGLDDDADGSARSSDGTDNDGDRWLLRNNGLDDDGDLEVDEADEGNLGRDEAGEGIDEEWYNSIDDDGDGQIDEDLRPLGDLMQVRYQWAGDSLRRGFQSPLGAARDPLDPSRSLSTDPERFALLATPVTDKSNPPQPLVLISGVLYFGVQFWTPHTTGWDEPLGKGDPDRTPTPIPGGPEELWDSTRGRTLADRVLTVSNPAGVGGVTLLGLDARPASASKRKVGSQNIEFYYYKPPAGSITSYNYLPPVLPAGASDSLFDPSDDVYPKRLQITLVVTNTRGVARSAVLQSPLAAASENAIQVDDASVFVPDTYPFVKIDHEWFRYSFIRGNTLVITEDGRGARGSLAAAHAAGTEVRTGTTFVLTLDLPSYRELKE